MASPVIDDYSVFVPATLRDRSHLGKVFNFADQKNHENAKPQSEMKTFSQRCRVALVEL